MSHRCKGEVAVLSKNSTVFSTGSYQLEVGLNSSLLGGKDNN